MNKNETRQREKKPVSARVVFAIVLVSLLVCNGFGSMPVAKAASDTTITPQSPRTEVQGGELDAASGLRNPRVTVRLRDKVTFGSYWQEDTNGDGVADEKDEKQPIQWQVLSVQGDDVFLMADKALDCQPYNKEEESVTWETCTLRKWLNQDFYESAFTQEEQGMIKETTVANQDNPDYGTEGGADTRDKIYLLSIDEVQNKEYGFGESRYDQARVGMVTAYAIKGGVGVSDKNSSSWWLRSPGSDTSSTANVDSSGYLFWHGYNVDYDSFAVRPALHLNLSSFSPKSVGTVETTVEKSEWDMVELGNWEGSPIQWRVLCVEEGDAFLLADRLLAEKQYHEKFESVTWETSTLRAWLNKEFYQQAFTASEKSGIKQYTWENEDNPGHGTEGGGTTMDAVALPSIQDMLTKKYGFPTFNGDSDTRIAYNKEGYSNYWWLRTPSDDAIDAAHVYYDGYLYRDGIGVNDNCSAVRPVLHVNLSSFSLDKVGTVSSADGVDVEEKPSTPSDGNNTGTGNPATPVTPPTASAGTSQTASSKQEKKKPGKVTSFKGQNKKGKTVTLTWKKTTSAKKYQVQYSQSKSFKKAKTKTVTKTNVKLNKLTKKKTYYFRVRAVSKDGSKGAWSKVVKIKIMK